MYGTSHLFSQHVIHEFLALLAHFVAVLPYTDMIFIPLDLGIDLIGEIRLEFHGSSAFIDGPILHS